MSEERLRYIRDLDTLACLVDHTPLLKINEHERVEVVDRLSAPVDEFGIPRPEIHIERLLGAMTTKEFVWTGTMDVHHMCTPKADFTVVRTANEGDIGSAFRGLARNKIEKPRLMHNFGHAALELPGRTPLDVMRQALFEVGQGRQLIDTINSHMDQREASDIDRAKSLCLSALRAQLEDLEQPQVNMMPRLDDLAVMEFDELRTAVSAIVSMRRFGHKRLIHPAIRKSGAAGRHLVTVDTTKTAA